MTSQSAPASEIRQLDAAEGQQHLDALAAVLLDCVEDGASVSFMWPFSRREARDYFATVLSEIETGKRILLAAFRGPELVGTVQMTPATAPNQPHRAEISKLLVCRNARKHGVGTLLMQRLEETARATGKTLLVLDTATGSDAERLYTKLGWTKAGIIPNYALFPDGRPGDTSIFWKRLD